MMKASPAAVSLIKEYGDLRLRATRDNKGLWTIGYGHKLTAKNGMQVTEDQAEKLLESDLEFTEERVRAITAGVALNQHQFDALVSFTFSVGPHSLRKSQLLVYLKCGDYEAAAEEFTKTWTRCARLEIPFLVRRRAAEQALFRRSP